MDLYGNLPPGDNSGASKPIIGNTWISSVIPNANKHKIESQDKKLIPVKNVQNLSHQPIPSSSSQAQNSKPTTTSKMIPPSLMFKPRQTSVKSVDQGQSKVINNQPAENHLESKYLSPTQPKIESQQIESYIIESEEKIEFNNNSSFEVDDPYDPRHPDDYMTFCSEREELKRFRIIEEENLKRLEEFERVREEKERIRKEAADKKDFQKLIEVSNSGLPQTANNAPVATGRGRGRGLLNLPAWLTQQMKPEDLTSQQHVDNNQNTQENNLGKRKQPSENIPSQIIVLTNMVNVNEVDNDLSPEIKAECQKYGKVRDCVVHIVKQHRFPHVPASELVRIFVYFDTIDSASKAQK